MVKFAQVPDRPPVERSTEVVVHLQWDSNSYAIIRDGRLERVYMARLPAQGEDAGKLTLNFPNHQENIKWLKFVKDCIDDILHETEKQS